MQDRPLAGKNVLLMSPNFFGYELAVRDKAVELGAAEVTYFDDRPSNSLVAKSLIRIDKRLFEQQTLQYYAKIGKLIAAKNFDLIFLLNPEALPISFLEMCRSKWPHARYIMYMWDAIKNRKHTLDFVPFCDRVFTFDRDDAKLEGFSFKPLFYLDSYASIRHQHHAIDYDLCFMATLHSDRYAIAKQVRDWCDANGLKSFFYFFMQKRALYYFNKLKNGGTFPPLSEVSFQKMNPAEVVKVVSSSRVVLDIQHPKQTGLTMRTLETIGAGKKLITTNPLIKDYDFYRADRFSILDRSNPAQNLTRAFFSAQSSEIDKEIIESYSIGSWLKSLLELD